MKVIVISSSPIVMQNQSYFAYSPYVRELQIWAKYSDEIAFMCPIWNRDKGLLISEFEFPIAKFYEAKGFNVKSFRNLMLAFFYSFRNFYKIFQAMLWADHIHLRCPGNIGLMGCIMQIFFPSKPKTAKYAGNWDPEASQPWSYKLQKYILENTFLTKNIQVLVYGQWEKSSKNIKPFFTATYKESDKLNAVPRTITNPIKFIYVGTLAPGKRAQYAIEIVEELRSKGLEVMLELYGFGIEKENLESYIRKKNISTFIDLKGNQSEDVIVKAYQQSHFLILPSKSEGWPKVVAESMFWGCLPIATKVSCVPFMLDHGNRGLLLEMDMPVDVENILSLIRDNKGYEAKVNKAIDWSRKYTVDLFSNEIKALLNP